jgi:hypothetical protein
VIPREFLPQGFFIGNQSGMAREDFNHPRVKMPLESRKNGVADGIPLVGGVAVRGIVTKAEPLVFEVGDDVFAGRKQEGADESV